jgi:uncharacterized protein GlcG (DUF336 family)
MTFNGGRAILVVVVAASVAGAGFALGWARRGAQAKHAPAFAADLHAAAPSAPVFPTGVAVPGPSSAAADAAAKAALAACAGEHVAVAVLDGRGALKLVMVPDGTAGVHGFYAWQKAMTALYFQEPTSKAVSSATEGSAAAKAFAGEPNLLKFPGGAPIFIAQTLDGAVGVSGAASVVDEHCALAGVAALNGAPAKTGR